ncbi:MAG: aldo/keto reductase [Bacteroidales bacterium]|nr:aldo/keto reductase [Bacteroidales bacterium]
MGSSNKINRRKFLKRASVSTLGAGMVSAGSFAAADRVNTSETAVIKEYRTFGKTGFRVSDISSGAPTNEAVLKAALDSGVNLIDAGEVYMNGNSERIIGRVLQDHDRSRFFVNSKLYTEEDSFPSKKEVIERTGQVLERIQSDYVDGMMIHSVENTRILKDEAFHAGMEQMKKEGKVRHVGLSCHGNNWAYNTDENLETILMTAIDDGRFDIILLAYNFVNAGMAEKILDKCEQKGIATMIMKSNPVHIFGLLDSRMQKMVDEGREADKFTQAYYEKYKTMNEQARTFFERYGIRGEKELKEAASRYVLSNPRAHTTLWDFQSFDDLEGMLGLSGQTLTLKDDLVLNGYMDELGHTACRIGCNDCEAACPENIPVNKILRYNYYFSVKKQEKRAMEKYARLELNKPSETCISCEGYCEQACSYGVWTRPLLAAAQSKLELIV